MPGSLAQSAPTTVLPRSLYSAFSEQRVYPLRESAPYTDGRTQRAVTGAGSRRVWGLTKQLSYSEWRTLETFFEARKGALEPFYFYPLYSDWDGTGASTEGRYIVRFDGGLSRSYAVGRQEVNLRLVQVA